MTRNGLRLLWRSALALILATLILLLGTLASFFAFGYLFGYSGHPAGPDLPAGCYLAYVIGAPALALAAAVWLVFRRRSRGLSRDEPS